MAINKARTSRGMKVLIIILIVSFVSLVMATGFAGFFDLFKSSNGSSQSTTSTTTAEKIAQQYDPQVSALRSVYESDPTSYTAAVNLANVYYDYALTLSNPGTGESEITSEAATAAFAQWQNAKSMYDKAVEINPADPAVQTDRSAAAYSIGDTTAAYEIAKAVTVSSPTFAPAWFNLGIFCEDLGLNDEALAAYQQYLALDPSGTSASAATARVTALSK
ncbi:MAG: tetratricopeptide repeat protein [Coriobacteriia bacterium]